MTEKSPVEVNSNDLFSKVQGYLTSKKGLYLILGLLMLGAIFYYKFCMKKDKKEETTKPVEGAQDPNAIPLPQQNYQPPPGYVTVPVEVLQGLQNEQLYSEIPQNNQQQNIEASYGEAPQLKHNNPPQKLDDDSEESEVRKQNLSKEDMESIQAQLSQMQQTRNNA